MQSQNAQVNEPMHKKERSRPEISWKVLVRLCLGCFVIWGLSVLLLWLCFGKWEERGQFGDSFGAVNALFSALAFAGVIYAIIIQQRELSLQVEELRDTREEFARQSKIMMDNLSAAREMQDFEKYVAHIKCEPVLQFVSSHRLEEIGLTEVCVPFGVITFNRDIDDYYDTGCGAEIVERCVKKFESISHVVYLANFGELILDVNITCRNVRGDSFAIYTFARLQRNCSLCLLLPKDSFDCNSIQAELRYVNVLGYQMNRSLLVQLFGGYSVEGYNSYLERIGTDVAGYEESKKEYESWLERIKSGEDDRDRDEDDESLEVENS